MTPALALLVVLAAQVGDAPPAPPASDDGFSVRNESHDDDVGQAALVGSAAAVAGAVGAGAATVAAVSALYSAGYAPTPGLAISLGLLGTALAVGVPFVAGWLAGAGALLALGRFTAEDWASLSTCVAGGYCGVVGLALLLPLALLGGGPMMMCRITPFAMTSFGGGREPWWMKVARSPAFPSVLGAGVGAVLVGAAGAVAGRMAIPGDVRADDEAAWLIIGSAASVGAAAGGGLGGFFGGAFAGRWSDAAE